MDSAFEICLFDLDDTLVETTDLKELREACAGNADRERLDRVRGALQERNDRHIFDLQLLQRIRADFPVLKLGIFTRAPRSYALTVLGWAYPGFQWDIVVAYEDVRNTKPYGDGIDYAMEFFGTNNLDDIVLVGDTDADVRSAYNCGCRVVVSRAGWPSQRRNEHWNSLGYIPDALIDSPDEILEFLQNPIGFLPELERLLDGSQPLANSYRFDKTYHLIPRAVDDGKKSYLIYTCGRSFSNHASVRYRRGWHRLTHSIEENKNSDTFPEEWINAIRAFIASTYTAYVRQSQNIIVSVVPHRPGRMARLESLLVQLQESLDQNPIPGRRVRCVPHVLAYRTGVRSQHNEFLNRDERFINVRDHLFVQQSCQVQSTESYVIIDDVATSGASLIYAFKYLKEAGAHDVKCLSLTQNVSKVLW